MPQLTFSEDTIDDLMQVVMTEILNEGEMIIPSRGRCKEIRGVLLELTNPLARLSHSEARGKPFSCLGELCWYLAGDNSLGFVEYYLSRYQRDANDGVIVGGYGPRLFGDNGQFRFVEESLRKKPDSRQAVIQLFASSDLVLGHKSIPCTCTLQFFVRGGKLELVAHMRSNDAYYGLAHDIFTFTMLQELMARSLSLDLGTYKHMVGSLHIYEEHEQGVRAFIDEGWQTTLQPMPAMPAGNPWTGVSDLLIAEKRVREDAAALATNKYEDVNPYWADLIRLLKVFTAYKQGNKAVIDAIASRMSDASYTGYIESKTREST